VHRFLFHFEENICNKNHISPPVPTNEVATCPHVNMHLRKDIYAMGLKKYSTCDTAELHLTTYNNMI
jgi:hypothetical protein